MLDEEKRKNSRENQLKIMFKQNSFSRRQSLLTLNHLKT